MQLGKSGVEVPRLGIGVMTWGDAKGLGSWHPSKSGYGGAEGVEEEKKAFEVSRAAGINLFDTAAMYGLGASERRMGDLIQGSDVIIASKFPGTLFFKVEDFPKELEGSLGRLRRNYIDLYQHHFPSDRVPIPKLMDQLANAVEAGKIRAVGVSNYSASQMIQAHKELARRGVALASNQVEYSLLQRAPETNGVLDACRELGITLIAYQPLASGALSGKYLAGERPKGLRRFMPNFRGRGVDRVRQVVELLREIGERYGKSPAQVAIRWLLEKENVLPIPGAKNSGQAAANAEALSFSLTSGEVETLDQASLPNPQR